MTTGLARVTISAPQRRVDVALPEQAPLAELLPEVLRHAGEGLADAGERHGGWVLRRTDGSVLATGQALLSQGVRDGEVLHLVPAQEQWPELEYDDVVEVIAAGARRHGSAWSGRATRIVTLSGAGVLLLVGLVAVLAGGPAWSGGPVLAVAVALLLTATGGMASRAYGEGLAGAALGGLAMPYAFVGGALLVSSGDPVGVVGGVRWLGAPELLAGSVALLLVSVLGAVGVAARLRLFLAGASVGAGGTLAALAGLLLAPAGAAAVLISALVLAVGALPLLAIRLGKVPLPPVTLPSGMTSAGADVVRDRPDRGRVYAAVARTEEMLTGLLLGHAVLVTAASVVLTLAGGTAARLLVVAGSAALLLRSRLFVAVRHRMPAVLAGLAGLALVGLELAGSGRPSELFGLVAAGLIGALLVAAAGVTYAQRPVSPYLGRAADLMEVLLVVSLVPVACAVLDLYDRARSLLG